MWEFESPLRHQFKERQREGITLAKQKGVYKGRKKALSTEDVEQLKARVAAGEVKAKVARDLGISRETLYQYLRAEA
ncbi:helix-turn-helix domain-containing protein [Spartinivicinus poritis]|uniref:helix-turn-helix domain-containing protein n=1 Tax=Spartinivicinus poritis TaxID=2994640 RepID=UPI003CC91F5B